MVRIVIELRVSSKQQTATDKEIPIPTQREIVHKAIERHYGDKPYVIVREFVEAGISAFKTASQDRDVIQEIKEMAVRKEFDVLWAYHSNRIGRRTEDGPRDVKFLNDHDIDVWTPAGEISTKTQMDKLITYIDFWENERESIEKSKIITDHHMIKVSRGEWRGGNKTPYGYKLVDNGSKNFKGKHILDLVKDEEETERKLIMFQLSYYSDYGTGRIAHHLNKQKLFNRGGRPWYASSVYYILTNPINYGCMRAHFALYDKDVESKIIPELACVSKEMFELNLKKMAARKQQQNNTYQPKTNHGKMLLSGIIFCGHCGSRLTTQTVYKRWTTADGKKHRKPTHRYRCGSFYKRGAIECDGQSTYGPIHIENTVLRAIKDFLLSLSINELNQSFGDGIKKRMLDFKKEYTMLQKEVDKKQAAIKALQAEISKVLLGQSAFSKDDLAEQIQVAKTELENAKKELQRSKENYEENPIQITKLPTYIEWKEGFESGTLAKRKVMIGLLVDKVTVFCDHLEIDFKISEEQYDRFSKSDQCVRVLA